MWLVALNFADLQIHKVCLKEDQDELDKLDNWPELIGCSQYMEEVAQYYNLDVSKLCPPFLDLPNKESTNPIGPLSWWLQNDAAKKVCPLKQSVH